MHYCTNPTLKTTSHFYGSRLITLHEPLTAQGPIKPPPSLFPYRSVLVFVHAPTLKHPVSPSCNMFSNSLHLLNFTCFFCTLHSYASFTVIFFFLSFFKYSLCSRELKGVCACLGGCCGIGADILCDCKTNADFIIFYAL